MKLMDAIRQANVGRCFVRDEGFHPQGASHQSRPCGTTRQITQTRKSVGSLYRMVLRDKLTTKLATSLASPLAATLASTLASVLAGTLASSLASTLASTWASRKPFNSSPPASHSSVRRYGEEASEPFREGLRNLRPDWHSPAPTVSIEAIRSPGAWLHAWS